ncbi:Gfo/Idh/MocA family protein [Streptomyces sp. NPDC004752]
MTVRLAVVGLGSFAHQAHLPAITAAPDMDLVAVYDVDPERGRLVYETYGVPHVVTGIEELKGLVDGVVIATPHTTHFALARQSLEAGLHVFVEKPMTTSAHEAWHLVDLAEQLGLHLTVGYTYQYAATAEAVRTAVRTDIGTLTCVNADFSSCAARFYAADVTDLGGPDRPQGRTYADPALSGGGQAQSQLTHVIANILWSTGLHPEQVFAFTTHQWGSGVLPVDVDVDVDVDVADAVSFRLAGNVLGAATSTGTLPDSLPPQHRVRYYGTSGMVEHDLLRAEAMVYLPDGSQRHIRLPISAPAHDHRQPVRDFAALIAGRTNVNRGPGGPAAETAAFIEALYASAATGQPVSPYRKEPTL